MGADWLSHLCPKTISTASEKTAHPAGPNGIELKQRGPQQGATFIFRITLANVNRFQ